jgi:hypothetical protein
MLQRIQESRKDQIQRTKEEEGNQNVLRISREWRLANLLPGVDKRKSDSKPDSRGVIRGLLLACGSDSHLNLFPLY